MFMLRSIQGAGPSSAIFFRFFCGGFGEAGLGVPGPPIESWHRWARGPSGSGALDLTQGIRARNHPLGNLGPRFRGPVGGGNSARQKKSGDLGWGIGPGVVTKS